MPVEGLDGKQSESEKGATMIQWRLSFAFVKNLCIGRVHQLPDLPDISKSARQAPWQAYGMVQDWDDTDLGSQHPAKEDAQKAVVKWYTDRENRPKKPCDVHSDYRKDCVMCKAMNQ
jgi:hypothetical protein